MADDSGGVELNLRVNADTGQIDTLAPKFTKAAEGAKQAEDGFKTLGAEARSLMGALLPIATAAAVVQFFTDCVKGAEDQNEAMRRLQGTLEANGQAWTDGGAAIKQWAEAIASSTRFTENEALQSLDKLTRSTGSASQAQAAAKLAMDLSVSSGKSLGEMTDFVNNLINKQQRAIMEAHKEFGTYTEKAQTAQEVLDALAAKVGGAAEKEDSLTKKSKELGSAFEEFKVTIGNAFAPALADVLVGLTRIVKGLEEFAGIVKTTFDVAYQVITGYNAAVFQALTGHFQKSKQIMEQTSAEIKAITLAGIEDVKESEEKKDQIITTSGNTRVNVTKRITDAEAAANAAALDKMNSDDAKYYTELSHRMAESAQKAIALETQIQDATLKLGDQTYAKKKQVLDTEYAYKKSVINKEILDDETKEKVLADAAALHSAQVQALDKADMLLKLNQSLEIMDLATQTFATLNQMGDQHSQGEVNRAKAILGLEKSIAIARAISSAMAAPPGFAQAIAVAQVAMVTAQFAQQMGAIDQAQAQYKSSQSSSSASAPVAPDISLPALTSSDIGTGVSAPAASSGGGVSTGGGGGGGSGTTNINVGGIVINFQPDKLSIDNVDIVMQKMYEKTRQATIEAVQLAVASSNLAAKNSTLAV